MHGAYGVQGRERQPVLPYHGRRAAVRHMGADLRHKQTDLRGQGAHPAHRFSGGAGSHNVKGSADFIRESGIPGFVPAAGLRIHAYRSAWDTLYPHKRLADLADNGGLRRVHGDAFRVFHRFQRQKLDKDRRSPAAALGVRQARAGSDTGLRIYQGKPHKRLVRLRRVRGHALRDTAVSLWQCLPWARAGGSWRWQGWHSRRS